MTGKEIKKLRESTGLSIAKAARQVEVTPRTWQRWEADERKIPDGAIKLFRLINDIK